MQNPYRKLSKVNPQKEQGHREICNPVFSALIRARLSGAEYQIILTVLDKSWGFGKQSALISLKAFQNNTSLSRQSVIAAIKGVAAKQIIAIHKNEKKGKVNEYLFNKHYDTWVVKQITLEVVKQIIPKWSSKSHQGSQVLEASGSLPKETILKKPLKKKDHEPQKVHDLLNEKRSLVFEGLKERRGYNSGVPGAEAKAITWMLNQGYTVEQILSAHDKLKKSKFWEDKFLNMQTVRAQIGELVKGKAPPGDLPTTAELEEGWKL